MQGPTEGWFSFRRVPLADRILRGPALELASRFTDARLFQTDVSFATNLVLPVVFFAHAR